MTYFISGFFVGALFATFIFALLTAGRDDTDNGN